MIAAKSFGKFQDSFLTELHAEILSHAKQEAAGLAPQPIQGIAVHDSDVLVPEPARAGGLFQRPDSVSIILTNEDISINFLHRHLAPHIPETQTLGSSNAEDIYLGS